MLGQKVITLDTIENTIYLGKFKLIPPSFFVSKYTYDPLIDKYIYTTKAGEIDVGIPLVLTPDQYRKLIKENNIKKYFQDKLSLIEEENSENSSKLKNLLPNLYINSNFFETIFGGDEIELTPQGSISMDIGARYQKSDNPSLSSRNQSNVSLDFNQTISLSMNGKIGERLTISSNYDTQSTFDFQNLLKLDYTPTEDDIIQKIELGNISMPLSGSLISGAQSLFGFKTELKFGNTKVVTVLSEQRSQSQTVVAKGDGSFEEFSIYPLDYDENRHFFLGQYFRDKYDQTLKTFPYLNTQIKITRIEIWVTNRTNQTQNVRNVLGLQDLGESNPEKTKLDEFYPNFITKPGLNVYPDNSVNKLDPETIDNGLLNASIRDISTVNEGFGIIKDLVSEGNDYSVLENARKLELNEYKLHDKLGYISLNQPLNNDEILAVAYQFTVGGEVFQVGEFANDGIDATSFTQQNNDPQISNNSLIVKLLKSSLTNINQPVWDLMMKNIYSIGSYQINKDDFKLNIFYTNPSPLNYIEPVDPLIWPSSIEGKTLLSLFNFDKLNMNNDIQNGGDGFFDFVPNITIDSNNGLIIFTSIEPFGEYLFEKLKDVNASSENYNNKDSYNLNQKKFVYKEIYDLSKTAAEENIEKNKFQIKGSYKTSGEVGGIAIGQFNVPRGSVKVTAGGRLLQEGTDYTVNYQAGRVQILDETLKNSNIPIEISTESNSFYSQQKKSFSGINIEHKFNDNFIIGGSLMNLSERSITQKANYGVEPVNNTMIGFNGMYSAEVPFLTRLANKLPNVRTEAQSFISLKAEVAYLHSGTPKNSGYEEIATVYVDDFEGSETNIDIKDTFSWNLSSVPENVNGSDFGINDLRLGHYRAKLAWYNIDPIFYTRQRPSGIDNNELSKNETRRIFIEEIFPQQDLIEGQSRIQNTLDLSYYPEEKGPYNNNSNTTFSQSPKKNWAGITRKINSTNFEQANVEFVQFWLLDTFEDNISNENELGTLVFNLGSISEDILKDGKKLYENGLPTLNSQQITNNSNWGVSPVTQSLVYSFDSDTNNRSVQDLGYDGMNDQDELEKYFNGQTSDPAGDNYQYYLNANGGILDRYKNYNGTQGNSPISVTNSVRGSTTIPDNEDANQDNTMNTIDSYFEYSVPIRKNMDVGNHPFISDVRDNVKVDLPNGQSKITRWIQFKIPVFKQFYNSSKYSPFFKSINGIDNMRSIRFMRIFLKDFSNPVTLRFGTLDLVRTDWKRYSKNLNKENITYPNTSFEIGSVNILENENRVPINYVLPPGVEREEINSNNTIIRQNEQSMSIKVNDLQPKDSRAVYKNLNFDMRQYKTLKMYIHAESLEGSTKLPGEGATEEFDKRLVGFIRIGSDFTDNYYQIEVPLKPTSFNQNSSNRYSADQVWEPESNSIDFSLEKLTQLKAIAIANNSNLSDVLYFNDELEIIEEFTSISSLPGDKKYKFAIKGNPTIGAIKNLMIGVKNPSDKNGDILSAEVWFNELRLSEIDGKGGWSALGSLDVNIADFANVSLSGKMSTIGFGSIDKTPNQRSREELKQYGFIGSVNLGKLLPEKWQIQVPLSYSVSKEFTTPEYDPFYLDIKLNDRLNSATRKSQKDSIRNQAVSYKKINSINLIGLKKNRSDDQKEKIYDIENFDFSYSYNQEMQHDYEIESLIRKTARASAQYSYTFNPFVISPFESIKFISENKYLEWLKEFNFNPLLSSISFNTNINRTFNSQRFRDVYIEGADASKQIALPDIQQRNFLFDWNLSLSQNLTNSLRLDFSASNNSIVKNYFQNDSEGNVVINKELDIWDGFWNTGEANSHNQSFQLSYQLPFKFFPLMNFISTSYSYSGDFNWEKGSDAMALVEDELGNILGNVNTIQNANTHTVNTSFNMSKFYKNLGLEKKKKPKKIQDKIINSFIGLATGLTRLKLNYAENNGKVLPGYTQSLGFLGTSRPSLAFVFGSQSDIRYEAAKNGWLTNFPSFNEQFTQVHNTKFDLVAELSLIEDLKIDINANRVYSENFSENFIITDNQYNSLSPNSFGNFAISTILIKTSFKKSDENESITFNNFQNNRLIIANRLALINGSSGGGIDEFGYPLGYGKNNQAVLIPAFISAYSGQDPSSISLSAIRSTPLPNWSLQYNGLINLEFFKERFKRFSIGHSYRSSYTLNSFKSNLEFDLEDLSLKDVSGNFLNEILYTNINLVEQFNPLLKIDMELKNSIRLVVALKKDRALSLSLDNDLLTESSGTDYSIGFGYRVKDLKFRNGFGGRQKVSKGDLNIKADVNIRDNITIIRNLNILDNKVTAGQTMWSLKLSADYALSKSFNAVFFYDHLFSKFAISTAFPMTTIRSGMTLRYNFGE
ncbi:MAG: cell surface protein SprA [Flavobacteriaceae bacterium]|nr:cell surface protein SprA [Flavobacteriaceae bacterium]